MQHRLAIVSLFALLAGCGTAHKVPDGTAMTPTVPTDGDEAAAPVDPRFGGTWYVSGVFPAAAHQASAADPHLGSALTIGAEEVSDVNGQRCVTPAFATGTADGASIGLKSAAGGWDSLNVTCAGKDFAVFLRLPDRAGEGEALMQRRPEGLYLLERAEALHHRLPTEAVAAMPVAAHAMPQQTEMAETPAAPATHKAPVELAPKVEPAPEIAAVPAAVPEGPVAEASASSEAKASKPAASADLPAKGTAMHLASYKGESAAKRGWKILLGEYDELDPLSPLYVTVDVPGKGPMVRLYATGAAPAEISRICGELRAKKVYCALNP
ncbi:hypothetical protein [Dongia sp.]|uniref:hypothetical protein n=1 Tax=Dongia sp. TaxID=1977262 RepID=UPI0035B3358D